MTFTIEFGWWILPAVMTVALICYAFKPLPPAYGYGAIGNGLVEVIGILFGLSVTLFAWFIWALVA